MMMVWEDVPEKNTLLLGQLGQKGGGHIGPTLAPEAILFESPCRAHSETQIAQIIC